MINKHKIKYPDSIQKRLDDVAARRSTLVESEGWPQADYESGLELMFILMGGWPAWQKLNLEPLNPCTNVSDTPQKILRWVKGSERLPQKSGDYHINKFQSHGQPDKQVGNFHGGLMYDTWHLRPEDFEWLDEVPTRTETQALPVEELPEDIYEAKGAIESLDRENDRLRKELFSLREQLAFERQLVQRQEATIAELTKALK